MGKLPKGITQAMVDAHALAYPPPKPLYADIDVVIEEAITLTAHVRRSRVESLRSMMPECNDAEILDELIDDFLKRMGAI